MLMPVTNLRGPRIVTPLPGPQASKLIEQDEHYTSPSYTRIYPLAVARGEGVMIEDIDGNRFLDFTSGIAVCSTGHCHPRIVRAIHEQASKLLHMSGTDFYYGPQADLAKKLAAIAPNHSAKRVFFTNSGAEAVEAAFKLARFHTKRQHMIAFYGAFHGRTMGALSLTASKVTQRDGFSPLIPQVTHIDYPNTYRSSGLDALQQLDKVLTKTVPPEEVAAIIVEPIQGEGGYIVPPPDFHQQLKEITERYGILYIADEVQAGMGRTGKMFAIEHWGVAPDIVCLAKGIASGMPLGAIIARESIMDWPPGSHASTFGGNPISCAAALETIALLEEELIDNASRVGHYLMARLQEIAATSELIGDVRGKGLMIGVELVRNRQTKEPAVIERNTMVQECFQCGLLLLGCGTSGIRFCPPLIVCERDVDSAMSIFEETLHALAKRP